MLWPIFVSLIVILLAATAYQHTQKRSIHRKGDKLRYGSRPCFEGPPISFLEPEQNTASFCLTKYRCGPATLPFLGNAVKFLQPRHLLFEWFVQCQRCFGFETFAISIPSLPEGVVISDPENLEYVLKNESAITKGEFFRRRSWDLFGVSYS
jgi:hypothetical protein